MRDRTARAQAEANAYSSMEQEFVQALTAKYGVNPDTYYIQDWATGFELTAQAKAAAQGE